MTYSEGGMTAMNDMTKETDAGLGHNQPLDPDGERAREAMRDYDISLAKEQVEREGAIDAVNRRRTLTLDRRPRLTPSWSRVQRVALAPAELVWVAQPGRVRFG